MSWHQKNSTKFRQAAHLKTFCQVEADVRVHGQHECSSPYWQGKNKERVQHPKQASHDWIAKMWIVNVRREAIMWDVELFVSASEEKIALFVDSGKKMFEINYRLGQLCVLDVS